MGGRFYDCARYCRIVPVTTMIILVIAILSMLLLAGFAWFLRRILNIAAICPVCVGVAGTWIWIVAGMYFGWLKAESWSLIAAIAMGGSVVGVAHKAEKHLATHCSPVLWKAIFIPTGFALMYSILSWWWTGVAVSFSLCIVWLLSCFRKQRHNTVARSAAIADLENKMKNNCC